MYVYGCLVLCGEKGVVVLLRHLRSVGLGLSFCLIVGATGGGDMFLGVNRSSICCSCCCCCCYWWWSVTWARFTGVSHDGMRW